ncbi:MAG: ATP-binding cassette domain-containing protein [Solirubrobacterales bacterium]|nr:ATP-binding cassette domain-containing protein [Solirubrobacterales bacterium]
MSEGSVIPAAREAAGPVPGVRMTGISKAYGSTVANDRVDFELLPGEIHVLLGENGAGKTTLMGILFGMVRPDAGEVRLGGETVSFSSPEDALERGVGMVHQHFMLVQDFNVAENVVLGSVSPLDLMLRRAEIERRVSEAAERFEMDIDPSARIRDLPIDTQQRVEILKLLYRGARIVILDEPTSSLGPAQIEALFAGLKQLREAGHSIVMVTHKLGEVMELADRVTVLKDGRNATTVARGEFDERSLAKAMTGRELPELPAKSGGEIGREPLLRVDDLVVHSGARLHAVHGVSFDLHPGEILGIAGVEGNGQRELLDALAGVLEIESGTVEIGGRDVTGASPKGLREAGLSIIHEDRQGWGLVLDMSLAENLGLADVAAGIASRHGFLRRRGLKSRARGLLEEYDVRPANPDALALSLSGGNQQKVVLARELASDPQVLIAANPVSGLDVGAADYVHRRLLSVREHGRAVLLISHDLDELLQLSDRIIVLHRGRILYLAPVHEVSIDVLSMAMAGSAPSPVADGVPASAPVERG